MDDRDKLRGKRIIFIRRTALNQDFRFLGTIQFDECPGLQSAMEIIQFDGRTILSAVALDIFIALCQNTGEKNIMKDLLTLVKRNLDDRLIENGTGTFLRFLHHPVFRIEWRAAL